METGILKMLIIKKRFLLLMFLFAVINFTCTKEPSCENCYENNKPPIAIAGSDQVITLPIDSVLLDGKSSNDPDGTISEWLWTKIFGPVSVSLAGATKSLTIVKGLVQGVYQFELKIMDNSGFFAKDTMQVIVVDPSQPPNPPSANAGPDQTIILPRNTVTLNGSASSDPNNNIISYAWTKISGPGSFIIANAHAIQSQVTNLIKGIYQFELKVTDADALFSADTVQITVNNQSICDNSNRPQVHAQLIPVGKLSQNRIGMAVASAGNKILFAGASLSFSGINGYGSSRVDIYDITTNTWATAELSAIRSDIAAVASGNKIFFAGGRLGDGAFDQLFSTVDIYDVSTNAWSVAALSEPRAYVSAAVVGNKVFFAGGEKDQNYNTSDKVDIYDVSTNAWSTAVLSEARAYVSAVTVGNKIYFAGGHREDRWYANPSNRIDIYDNTTNTWSTSSLNSLEGPLAATAEGDKIYWAANCTVEIKDVNTLSISTANLFKPAAWNLNAVVKDGKIIFFGGDNKFDVFDVATNSWSIGAFSTDIAAASFVGASIISVNNTIYVAGGATNGNWQNGSNQVWKLEF